jgi:Putative transmembrane protein (PGPGW)
MVEWIGLPASALWWIAIASAALFLLALLLAPLTVTRIPVDYFAHPHRSDAAYPRKYLWFRWIWLIVKNVLGYFFLFFGFLMLVLPGQGILTILIAFTLLDFPGKFRLQRWVVTRKGVLSSINWVRQRMGGEPLQLEPPHDSGSQ